MPQDTAETLTASLGVKPVGVGDVLVYKVPKSGIGVPPKK